MPVTHLYESKGWTMEISLKLLPESERRHAVMDGMDSLPFGQLRCDHMFVMEYEKGQWINPRIEPYANFSIPPGAIALHYGQAIFEGAKAFRHADGEIYTFRFNKNAERLNRSADILCMPHVPEDMQMEGLMRLLDIERKWCPTIPESSLYIRPFLFATEDTLGVKPSGKHIFCIMLSPSGPYYAGGFNKTVTLLITEQFHRATPGGTGAAKAAGNYAASLRAQEFAHSKGAAQVLYLDATNTYLEEVGAMNHFHVLRDGSLIIPEFTDTILQSITSESVLEMLPNARQERIKLTDFVAMVQSGEIVEAGGFGTAAVITPVGRYITDAGESYEVGDGSIGPVTRALYERYTGIQKGTLPDTHGWLQKVPHF